jgi:hypothetical protein
MSKRFAEILLFMLIILSTVAEIPEVQLFQTNPENLCHYFDALRDSYVIYMCFI